MEMEVNLSQGLSPKKFWWQSLTTKIAQLKDEQVFSQNQRSYSVFKVESALQAWLRKSCPEWFLIFNVCQEVLIKSLLASSARENHSSFCNIGKW